MLYLKQKFCFWLQMPFSYIWSFSLLPSFFKESSEKETVSVSLIQTVAQLQQLLQAVNQQLTKEKEHCPVVGKNNWSITVYLWVIDVVSLCEYMCSVCLS